MSETPPEPPASLPPNVAEELAESSVTQLDAVARYASALAEFQRRESTPEQAKTTQSDAAKPAEDPADGAENTAIQDLETPADVPSKATVTTKTINDNQYRYWQWRDGDTIRSKYIEPVSKNDSDNDG